MSDSADVSVVRRSYEARGNPDVIREGLASEVRWEVVAGFPHRAVLLASPAYSAIPLAASSRTLTNSSRRASSFSSQVNASSCSAPIAP